MRQAARAAGTDKKTLALEKEAKEQAKRQRRWTIGTIATAVVLVIVLLLNFGLLNRSTAYTAGDRKYSVAEMNYHYGSQYNYFANQYGSYASMFGLDTSGGLRGLRDQACPMLEEGKTWRDYFLESAENEAVQTKVLLDYAAAQGISLTEEELAELEQSFAGLEATAQGYGYKNADLFLTANYGSGVTPDIMREAYREATLASKANTALSESFTYSDEELAEKYESYEGSRDYFSYLYSDVRAVEIETGNEDGEKSSAPTPETLADAKKTADAIAAAYKKAGGTDYEARLTAAAEAEGQTVTTQTRVTGSGLYYAADWLKDASRKAGDVTVAEDSSGSGYRVVVFLSRDDNNYRTASVRHILIKAEQAEDGSWTDEAKAAAKAKAEEVLAEYEAGPKTVESFIELVEKYSEDGGSVANGGLYENIAKGQMVEEFEAFCFAPHKTGDTGIVYGESSSYAGYHVMLYVGEGELYRNVLAEADLRQSDTSAYIAEKTEALAAKENFGIRFVG